MTLRLAAFEVAEFPRRRPPFARRLLSWSLTGFALLSLIGCFHGH